MLNERTNRYHGTLTGRFLPTPAPNPLYLAILGCLILFVKTYALTLLLVVLSAMAVLGLPW